MIDIFEQVGRPLDECRVVFDSLSRRPYCAGVGGGHFIDLLTGISIVGLCMDNEFDDIRPYNDAEFREVLKRIFRNRWLVGGLRKEIFPRCPSPFKPLCDLIISAYLYAKLVPIHTVDQFQRKIIGGDVIPWLLEHTTDGLYFSGLEYLDEDEPYTFISNHRDILLDPALLNYVLASNGLRYAAIAFGDNLMINDLIADLIRVNKCFIVKRNLPFKERIQALHHLSKYIWLLHQQGQSVWIAQREGRAKDGEDRTNPSLSKMLYLSQRKEGLSFPAFIRIMNIVPVSISYEKDPCDLLKAREMNEIRDNCTEEKMRADLQSMYYGLRGDKGRIHVAIGKRLCGEYQTEQEVAREIDRTIHRIYKLWPSNYIAYDKLMDSREYLSNYSPEESRAFLSRFAEEPRDIREKVLAMYARPLVNQRALQGMKD